ncbi:hypothetical protein ACFV4P_34380 [Kitasatospora sp. NPDC059795]|uniref:hypothetical protein n=1 Tax=Kitasatospora sp. NPDC059795 TaxID=3346949 RepID=UPI0036616D02
MIRLDTLIGAERAAAHVTALSARLLHVDRLPADTALRVACERVAEGDPIALAAPGQTWSLRPGIDPDDAPAMSLLVLERLTCPPRAAVEDEIGFHEVLPLTVLAATYELTAWEA